MFRKFFLLVNLVGVFGIEVINKIFVGLVLLVDFCVGWFFVGGGLFLEVGDLVSVLVVVIFRVGLRC